MAIRFGTSGWRALFADEFTFPNVRRLIHSIAGHVKESADFGFPSKDYRQHAAVASGGVAPTVVVGYDPRFMGEQFAAEAAMVFAQDAVRVLLSKGDVPTPAVAWALLENHAVGGIVVTASHNPARYNGIKWSPFWAGPATAPITEDIERRLGLLTPGIPRAMAYDKAVRDGWIAETDFGPGYYKQLKSLLDPKALKSSKLKIGVDAMNGAARTYLRPFLDSLGLKTFGLREEREVLFGGVSPEPEAEKLGGLSALMKKERLDIGLACDGDADRFGVMDAGGAWISANEVLALAYYHLVKNRKMTGGVARSLMTSHFVDAVAKSHGQRVRETPVGFKHIGELLRGGDFLLGGEESAGMSIRGHVPEKDGLLAGLLMAELVAFEKRPLAKVRDELFKKHGEFHTTRVNFELEGAKLVRELNERLRVKPPTTLAGASVWRIDDSDGFKFILKDGRWLGLRFSGTESVVRLYAEAKDPKGLAAMVEEGKRILKGKL
ncbi:MAG: phosphoglucomutase/phosphomannomutase family protein [Elusimicrobia bacterium]|nr:phosphoglucomutase/phosphomannomutase family protein [Elusimicrobiota bacterium]